MPLSLQVLLNKGNRQICNLSINNDFPGTDLKVGRGAFSLTEVHEVGLHCRSQAEIDNFSNVEAVLAGAEELLHAHA